MKSLVGVLDEIRAILSGETKTKELPTVTAADNGKVLMVVDGVWAAAELPADETTDETTDETANDDTQSEGT